MFYGPTGAGIALAIVIAGALVMLMLLGVLAVIAGWMRLHELADLAACVSIAAGISAPALVAWLTGADLSGAMIALYSIPGWLGLCALMISAARRQEWPAGHCQSCGYDLRGNRQAASCPECGAAIHNEPLDNAAVPTQSERYKVKSAR